MDKSKLKKLALMGMAGGLLVASQVSLEATEATTVLAHTCGAGSCASGQNHGNRLTAEASMQQKNMSEKELLSQLNDQTRALYNSLDTDGKALAMKNAQSGQFSDKNQAVRAAADQTQSAKRVNVAQ